MSSVRFTLAACFAVAVAAPAGAQITPRPGEPGPTRTPVVRPVPRQKTACIAATRGTAPAIINVQPKSAWATTVSWSQPTWATGYRITRALTPNGPFVEIVLDTSRPAPQPSATASANTNSNATIIGGQRVLTRAAPNKSTAMGMTDVSLVGTDTSAAPKHTYYYRVTAEYRKPGAECPDSGDAGSQTSAAVTTPYTNLTGFTATADVDYRRVFLSWDEPPRRPDQVIVRRNKVPDPAPQFVIKDGKRTYVDNTPVTPAAPPLYEVQAVYGNVSIYDGNLATVPKIWGFADLHVHHFAKLGFGGIGIPFLPTDQVDLPGLKRAYEGGLRLIVMQAVNTEIFCRAASAPAEVITSIVPGANIPRPGLPCDDSGAIDRQIAAAKAFEASSGGWYKIVYTPAEARRAIVDGKLAVVLGIEVDNLLDCRFTGAVCQPDQLAPRLARLQQMGVRQVIPIHLSDNGFGGHALYDNRLIFNNKFLTGMYPAIRDCSAEGFEYRFVGADIQAQVASKYGALGTLAISPIAQSLPNSPAKAWCNAMGLTALGEQLIGELMSRKMLIDIDHMSALAADRTIQLALQRQYPVLTSHSGYLDASLGAKRAEGQQTRARVAAIRQLRGVVSAIVDQGMADGIASVAGVAGPIGAVQNNCNNSSRTWAQAYTVAALTGPVAFGSDFNGAPSMGPRFGAGGCERVLSQSNAQDPNTRVPDTVFAYRANGDSVAVSPRGALDDFNTAGLSHIGLYPEFIADLRRIGITRAGLEPLFHSADAFISMWELIWMRDAVQ